MEEEILNLAANAARLREEVAEAEARMDVRERARGGAPQEALHPGNGPAPRRNVFHPNAGPNQRLPSPERIEREIVQRNPPARIARPRIIFANRTPSPDPELWAPARRPLIDAIPLEHIAPINGSMVEGVAHRYGYINDPNIQMPLGTVAHVAPRLGEVTGSENLLRFADDVFFQALEADARANPPVIWHYDKPTVENGNGGWAAVDVEQRVFDQNYMPVLSRGSINMRVDLFRFR